LHWFVWHEYGGKKIKGFHFYAPIFLPVFQQKSLRIGGIITTRNIESFDGYIPIICVPGVFFDVFQLPAIFHGYDIAFNHVAGRLDLQADVAFFVMMFRIINNVVDDVIVIRPGQLPSLHRTIYHDDRFSSGVFDDIAFDGIPGTLYKYALIRGAIDQVILDCISG